MLKFVIFLYGCCCKVKFVFIVLHVFGYMISAHVQHICVFVYMIIAHVQHMRLM